MKALHARPGLGRRALGVPDWDARLHMLGKQWVLEHPGNFQGPGAREGDVYLATQLYAAGGHTALMGDFVRALGSRNPHVILTNLLGHNKSNVSEKILQRLGVPGENVRILTGPEPEARLNELMELLGTLRPGRIILFHHPEDPLASVVTQPECAEQTILVHHADSVPSFGLHLPGVLVVDLNPIAASFSRSLGLEPALIRLTSPDPGPRPVGFLQRGALTTATSGSHHKFTTPYRYGYAETVAVILQATGGWHVHIGPLDQTSLANIHRSISSTCISPDKFIHIPWTPSVAHSLWDQQCDVYFSSFPIDGARTDAEVLASATPHLRHTTRKDPNWIEGGLEWQTWEDLAITLNSLNSLEILTEKSWQMRAVYERHHHPLVFQQTLQRILETAQGCLDEFEAQREARTAQSWMRTILNELNPLETRIAELEAELASLRVAASVKADEPAWVRWIKRWK